MGWIAIGGLRHRSEAPLPQVLLQAGEHARDMHASPQRSLHVCADQPRPDSALVVGGVASVGAATMQPDVCGVGRGHAWLYHGLGIPITESKARYEEALEILMRAWTAERFSYEGQFWQIHNARVVPRPLQKPHPPILTGGTSEATSELAGARGYGLFLAPVFPFAALERQIRIYQESCAKHGHTPYIIYLRPIYLGDDPAQVRRECEPSLLNFLA